jgi:hypothetical protein
MPATLTHPIPKGRPLNRADFQHAEVRAAVARALARRSAPFGLQPVTSNEPPIVIPDLLSRAQNVAAHQATSGRPPRLVIDGAQLQATVAFLSQGIQEASGGLKANVVFNGYPAAFSFTDNGALISNLDMGSEMAWHEWFAPMARLGYTARLSHEQLTEMAEVYKKALLEDESATLSEADRRGLALYEYALNLLYIFYHADLSYQKPDGTPAAEPEARAYLANAQVVLDRARQDQRRLRGLIPTLDLPHGGAMRLI